MTNWKHQAEFELCFTNPRTQHRVSISLEAIKDFLHAREPNNVFKVDILNYRDRRLRTHKPSSVKLELTFGKMFWNWLLEREYIDHNPFVGVKMPKLPPPERRWLKPDIVARLRENCPENLRIAMEIFAVTPLTCIDVALLHKENFDFQEEVVKYRRRKTGKEVIVPVPDSLLALISGLPTGPLYPELIGHSSPGNILSKRFSDHCKKLYGKNFGAHSMRHTYGSEAIANGVDIRTLKEIMSHSDINTTARYLTPINMGSVRKFLEKIPPTASPLPANI